MSDDIVFSPRTYSDPSDFPVVLLSDDPLEANDDIDMDGGGDSGLDADSSGYSSTSSLTPSIRDLDIIGQTKREYHRSNPGYWAPGDATHSKYAEIINHLCFRMLDGRLYLAPLDANNMRKALDIGTGFGHWAIDFADAHPNTVVIGTDLSPIQPSWVPGNLSFQLDDATRPWTFEDESVDYVHMRFLYGSIPDWDELFRQAHRVLKPGGFVETFETEALFVSDDDSLVKDKALEVWGRLFAAAGRKTHRSFHVVSEDLQRKGVEAAGFEGVVQHDFTCPISPWPHGQWWKDLGHIYRDAMEQDAEGLMLYVVSEILDRKWTEEQITRFLAELQLQLKDTDNIHASCQMRCIYAQKPLRSNGVQH